MSGNDDSHDGDGQLPPVREGELISGKYVAGHVIGIGGMGIVIAARDQRLDRRVAIKFLLPGLAHSDRAVQRFVREARMATRISSEHVVRLLEINELPTGLPFFVMEFLEGRDLKAMLVEQGSLPLVRAVDYLLQALEAIAEGHRLGIVHRDIKPSNLFVTRHADSTPLVKVLDFGIAKTLAVAENDTGLTGPEDTRLGSPAYMSPEQLRNPSDVDVRSDVWALGVTLYELVCGSQPFFGKTYAELVLSIAKEPADPPRRRRSDLALPAGFDEALLRCLEKDRAHRYASAADVAAALAPFGSAEAGASLKRIRALALRSDAGDELLERTTTNPAEDVAPRSSTQPNTVQIVPARPSSARWRVAGAVLVALALLAVLAWNLREKPAFGVGPPEAPAGSAEVAGPLLELALPAASPAVEGARAPEAVASTLTAPAPAAERPRTAATQRVASRGEPVNPAPKREETPVVPASSAIDSAPLEDASPPSPGRSPIIEKLIENRR